MNASRLSSSTASPPEMVMSTRHTANGSRVASAAARSQLSSAARDHSSSALRIASSGRPAKIGSRIDCPSCSRIVSAVMYITWSLRTCAASWAITTRRPSPSSSRTSSELRTITGRPEPNVSALAIGNCVRYRSGTSSRSRVWKTSRSSTQIRGSCSCPRRTAAPSIAWRIARSYPSSMRRRTTCSRYGTCRSAAVAARSAGCWNARGEMPSSWKVLSGSVMTRRLRRRERPRARRPEGLDCGSMRAVTIQDKEIVVEDRPDPEPGSGEILVRVKAAGINGADIMQRGGLYPAPPGAPKDIPGLEFAGEGAALGPGATRFSEGDRVMAVVGGGGQAGLVTVHERQAMPVPDALEWPQAGGTPEVFTTAHDAIFTQAGLGAGERFLVHGAAGGVGTAAVQLGASAGARVTATVRRAEARDAVRRLGAHEVLDPEGFEEHGPFDVILELVG